MTHVPLRHGEAEVLSWIDDHSRYALSVTAHHRVNSRVVCDTFVETAGQHGFPAVVLSDNGMYYTARFARGGDSGPNRFERLLASHDVVQKNSRPRHPQTCGKVERFQQTLKKWLAQQPAPADLFELEGLLDRFVRIYNHERPHRSLARRTPHVVYGLLPKDTPRPQTDDPVRVRYDRVDSGGKVSLRHEGRLHHIGIGRAHIGVRIVMIINRLDIRVVATETGELLRQLTLDPTRDYQPTGKSRSVKRT